MQPNHLVHHAQQLAAFDDQAGVFPELRQVVRRLLLGPFDTTALLPVHTCAPNSGCSTPFCILLGSRVLRDRSYSTSRTSFDQAPVS